MSEFKMFHAPLVSVNVILESNYEDINLSGGKK